MRLAAFAPAGLIQLIHTPLCPPLSYKKNDKNILTVTKFCEMAADVLPALLMARQGLGECRCYCRMSPAREVPASKRSILKSVREHWRTGFHSALCRCGAHPVLYEPQPKFVPPGTSRARRVPGLEVNLRPRKSSLSAHSWHLTPRCLWRGHCRCRWHKIL